MTIYVRVDDGQFLYINNPSWIHFESEYNTLTIVKDSKTFRLTDPDIDMTYQRFVDSEGIEDLVRMFPQEINLKVETLNLFER